MNDIFNFFSPLSFVKSGIVSYNPLINYDWSTTTTSGLRYLKDVGSTPTYNASMYFGRGAYLNGVDQTITVPINTTIKTALKRVNGIVIINETSQTLTNYMISGVGVHKDYYLFTRLLTPAEKDSYTNTLELFYTMAQSDITCVLNMPMCETDGYARNMKSYSEVSVVNEEMDNFSNFTNFANYSTLSSSRGILTHISLAVYAKIYIRQNLVANTTYKIEVDLTEASSLFELKCSYIAADNSELGRIDSSTPTKLVLFIKPTTSGSAFVTLQNSVSGKTLNYNYLRVTAVTGAYPITNYTTSVRNNAKNLQYGLQTCKFVRNSLGVIQGASDYLECDGVGYGNTGWIPDLTKDFSLETICVTCPISDGAAFIIGVSKGNTIRFLFREGYCTINIGNVAGIISSYTTNQKIYGVLTYNSITKSIKIYFGDNLNKSQTLTTLTAFTGGVYLGGTNETSLFKGTTPIRLFKVHNKELTQTEITDSYNSYTAKGLLS